MKDIQSVHKVLDPEQKGIIQWFLTLLEVLNPASFISAFIEPFVIGKIAYDFFKT